MKKLDRWTGGLMPSPAVPFRLKRWSGVACCVLVCLIPGCDFSGKGRKSGSSSSASSHEEAKGVYVGEVIQRDVPIYVESFGNLTLSPASTLVRKSAAWWKASISRTVPS